MQAGAFVIKRGKPPDKSQLEADLNRLKPLAQMLGARKTIGGFFDLARLVLPRGTEALHYVHKKIDWNDILYITSNNGIKNTCSVHLADGSAWLSTEQLYALQQQMPPFITQFNKSDLVNVKKIERSSKSPFIYFLQDLRFEISDTCASAAMAVIRLFLNQA
jgi:DNA-binding LytR/AlgR family response regulator